MTTTTKLRQTIVCRARVMTEYGSRGRIKQQPNGLKDIIQSLSLILFSIN